MKRMLVMVGVFAVSFTVLAGGWKFSVEPQYRSGMNMKLDGYGYANDPSMAALFPGRNHNSGLSWRYAPRPDPSVVRPPTDDITQFATRTFDDGYVGPCEFTTDVTPYTWYWGWQNAGQYDGDAQQLTFTRTASSSAQGTYQDVAEGTETRSHTSVLLDERMSGKENFNAVGLEVAAQYTLLERENLTLDLTLGLAGWWGEKVAFNNETFAAEIREDSYNIYAVRNYAYDYSGSYLETYTYNDPFMVVPSTAPGYQHGYDFDFGGPNPIIDALPASRDVTQTGGASYDQETSSYSMSEKTGSKSWAVANAVQVGADVNNVAMRWGVAANWRVMERLSVFAQPLVSLNYVQADLERKEQLTSTAGNGTVTVLRSWQDSASEEEWVVGLGARGGFNLDLGGDWFVKCSAGYEWMTRKPEFDVGPSTVQMDLDAFELSAGLGRFL
ncbi:MAG: hypothetical protein V2A34_12645 [Lentisphaerota bacterium]